MTLFFDYHMPNYTYPGTQPEELIERVVEFAQAAEKAAFTAVTVMDHFYQIAGVGPEAEPMLEGYTTLAAIAARTNRIRLGTLVSGVTYRNPAILAKTATTLDVISKGRAIFGLGAAWNESEHAGYGVDFPPIKERMDRLDEALAIAKLMFTEERPSFQGKHYRLERALNSPRPIQPGGPPILVGGGGEKRTLRIAAKYADITHWFGQLPDLKRKLEVLAGYCEEEGRDSDAILKTAGAPILLAENEAEGRVLHAKLSPERQAIVRPVTVEQAPEVLGPYIEAGFGGFTLNNPTLPTLEAVARAGELIALLNR